MKKIIYMIALFWAAIGMISCEKEVKDYDGEEGVYFYVQWGAEWGDTTKWANQSYTPVEFVNILGDTYEVKVRVMSTGRVKDYDRTFQMVVDKDSTTAVVNQNYEPFEEMQVIKAGQAYADVVIHLKRNENIMEVEKVLGLRLFPTNDFIIGIPEWGKLAGMWSSEGSSEFDASVHKIIMSDFIVKPARWIGGIYDQPGDTESGRWGVFTVKKYKLICDQFDLTYEDFQTEATMPVAKRAVIQEHMANYLQELYDKGTPVLEDDGRLMWFMGVSWTSVVGVPWVPEQ